MKSDSCAREGSGSRATCLLAIPAGSPGTRSHTSTRQQPLPPSRKRHSPLQSLGSLRQLHTLSLSHVDFLRSGSGALSTLPALHRLTLRDPACLNDGVAHALRFLPHLAELCITDCSCLTDWGMHALLSSLPRLGDWGNAVENEGPKGSTLRIGSFQHSCRPHSVSWRNPPASLSPPHHPTTTGCRRCP